MGWVANSLIYFRNGGEINNDLAIAVMMGTSLLLIHSAYLHKSKFKKVRILADIWADHWHLNLLE